jgi:hypothetical protein
MDDLCGGETVRRQTSVTDGEAIKIVIHDVDSDSNFSTYFVVLKLMFDSLFVLNWVFEISFS